MRTTYSATAFENLTQSNPFVHLNRQRLLEAERNAYEAFFETVWPRPWVMGAYPWKWFSYPDHGKQDGNDYDIEGKPAEEVVRRTYRR